jgi:hypothetical protein
MKTIIDNDYFTLYDYEENNIYEIILSESNKELCLSFVETGLITGGIISKNNSSIRFQSKSVKLLETNRKDISVNSIIKLIYSLSIQLKYLCDEHNMCFFSYEPAYILVIDDNTYIYVCVGNIWSKYDDNICIDYPLKKNIYFSPEWEEVKKIPSYVNYKSSYYSLGLMCIYLLNSKREIDETLLSLEDTKLYWFLKRSLERNVKDRMLLFI